MSTILRASHLKSIHNRSERTTLISKNPLKYLADKCTKKNREAVCRVSRKTLLCRNLSRSKLCKLALPKIIQSTYLYGFWISFCIKGKPGYLHSACTHSTSCRMEMHISCKKKKALHPLWDQHHQYKYGNLCTQMM